MDTTLIGREEVLQSTAMEVPFHLLLLLASNSSSTIAQASLTTATRSGVSSPRVRTASPGPGKG